MQTKDGVFPAAQRHCSLYITVHKDPPDNHSSEYGSEKWDKNEL